MNITLIKYDTIDSTNTEALKQARLGVDEGFCVVARQQTAGRGRYGRVWVSEKDAGLYFSIVLRPQIEPEFLPLITLMAGVAVHETLKHLGISADIKWVNDILVNEKKISGILAEAAETEDGLAVVVGIGINVLASNYSPEIAQTATSIENETASANLPDPANEHLLSTLIANIDRFYSALSANDGPLTVIDEWSRRSSYFKGKEVRVNLHDEIFTGVTDGLQESGALRLILPDGTIRIIHSGDVGRVRAHKAAQTRGIDLSH